MPAYSNRGWAIEVKVRSVMDHQISIVPYNPDWPHLFKEEASLLQEALGANCLEIHHMGSTSVAGLAAKPIIDILPVVKDILKVDPQKLEDLYYTARGELGMAFRRYFHKGEGMRTHHVHVWEEGSPEIQKHLLFCDYLRQNPEEREKYARLKYHLATQFKDDPFSYGQGKEGLIKEILEKAGFNGFTLVQALTEQEWKAYHEIRRQEIQSLGLSEPFFLKDEGHFHFVFYQGIHIVSVAHLEFLNNHETALHALATHDLHKGKGFATQLLALLERWLLHQGRIAVRVQAPLEYGPYYKNLGYAEGAFTQIPLPYPTIGLKKDIR